MFLKSRHTYFGAGLLTVLLLGSGVPITALAIDTPPATITAAETESHEQPAPPRFSHAPGFFEAPFQLVLSAEAGHTIHFTTDGSRPTVNSPVFSGTVLIDSPAATPANSPMSMTGVGTYNNLDTRNHPAHQGHFVPNLYYNGRVIRAMAVDEAGNQSEVVTGSFFVENNGRGRFNVPVISIALEPEHFADPVLGMYHNWYRGDWPAQAGIHDTDGPRHQSNFEMFDATGQLLVSQYANTWVFGNWSRQHPQRSIRFNFHQAGGREITGVPNLIPDTRLGFHNPLQILDTFRHLSLRTSDIRGDGRTGMRDSLVALISEPLRPTTQNSVFGAVFVNGEFWGMYDFRTHRHAQLIAQLYDVPAGQVQLEEWAHGFIFNEYFQGRDMTAPGAFEELNRHIDMDSLIDYFIIGMHFDNQDWIGNNFEFWRTTSVIEGNPFGDGRWRFVVQDFDEAINHPANNPLQYFSTDMPSWSAFSHEWIPMLFENETFRNSFAARYATYLGTAFHPELSLFILDNMECERLSHVGSHLYRWGYHEATTPTDGVARWRHTVEHDLRYFVRHRGAHGLDQLRGYLNGHYGSRVNLGLDSTGFTNIDWRTNGTERGWLAISGAEIRADLFERQGVHGFSVDNFSADYIRGLPIEVHAVALPGYTFSHFSITGGQVSRVEQNPMVLTPAAGVGQMRVDALFIAPGESEPRPIALPAFSFNASEATDSRAPWPVSAPQAAPTNTQPGEVLIYSLVTSTGLDRGPIWNSGSPQITEVGRQLVISQRTNNWYSIDVNFDSLGMVLGNTYRFVATGTIPSGIGIGWGQATEPWEAPWGWVRNQQGNNWAIDNTFVHGSAELGDTPRLRLQVQWDFLGDFTVDSIQVYRVN